MHMAKAVATQVVKKTVTTALTIGGRAAPACQVASGLRGALSHGGSRWLSTPGGTAAGGEERPSGSGSEDLLRGLSADEVKRVPMEHAQGCPCPSVRAAVPVGLVLLDAVQNTKAVRSYYSCVTNSSRSIRSSVAADNTWISLPLSDGVSTIR